LMKVAEMHWAEMLGLVRGPATVDLVVVLGLEMAVLGMMLGMMVVRIRGPATVGRGMMAGLAHLL